jgi:hypothetical protein
METLSITVSSKWRSNGAVDTDRHIQLLCAAEIAGTLI